MPPIPEEDDGKPRTSSATRLHAMSMNQTEDFDESPAALAQYLKELADVDLRGEWGCESDDESGIEDNDTSTSQLPSAGSSSWKRKQPEDNEDSTSEPLAAGSSSSCKRRPKRCRTNKHKTHVGNRPPFIKNRPPKRGEVGYDTFVPEYFTMGELEDLFFAKWEYVFHHRMTWYAFFNF